MLGYLRDHIVRPVEGQPVPGCDPECRVPHKNRSLQADGFYDGDGVYRVRFMPERLGAWRYVTRSNVPALDGQGGEFLCVAPPPGNHGPVHVRNTYHFAYADGTPYLQSARPAMSGFTRATNWRSRRLRRCARAV